MKKRKAQSTSADFLFGFLLFTLAVTLGIKFIVNLQPNQTYERVYEQTQTISENLISEGYPSDWPGTPPLRLGLTTNGSINEKKWNQTGNMPYREQQKTLTTTHDYLAYLTKQEGNIFPLIRNITIGYPGINTSNNTHELKILLLIPAGCFSAPHGALENEIKANSLNIMVECKNTNNPDALDNIQEYDFVIGEEMQLRTFPTDQTELFDTYIRTGGIAFIGGKTLQVLGLLPLDYLGITLEPRISSSTIHILHQDTFLNFTLGETYYFDDPFPISEKPSNPNVSNYVEIANYTTTEEVSAIARWDYFNGTVYFFGDMDAPFTYPEYIGPSIEEAMSQYLSENVVDYQIDSQQLNADALVSMNRIITRKTPYEKEIIRLVVWTWKER